MAEAARKIRYSNYGTSSYDPYRDGNTIRFPGRVEAPRPRVLPREKAASRPRVQPREAGRISPFALIGTIAIAVFAAMVLFSYAQLTAISNDVVTLQHEYHDLKAQEAHLMAQYELAFDLKSIESKVTADGRMVRPQESQIHYMDLSGNDSVVVYEDDSPTATLGQTFGELLHKLTSYFQ